MREYKTAVMDNSRWTGFERRPRRCGPRRVRGEGCRIAATRRRALDRTRRTHAV